MGEGLQLETDGPALQYLQEHKLTDYEELAASTEAAVDRFHALAGKLRETEAALSHTVQLMGATVDFAKNRPVFDGYKAARYSKKYLAQHEAELAAYRAAKAAMNDLLGGAKLPKMAQKNGGTRFSYASSVSLAAFIAWIVASTIFNSFSSRALSRASIRFLHSLPLFLDG